MQDVSRGSQAAHLNGFGKNGLPHRRSPLIRAASSLRRCPESEPMATAFPGPERTLNAQNPLSLKNERQSD
ncbi:hypothetical protein [Cribrihabitans pelagius]|uniref:hypothetical protein n=1 Tax=Cribrihabitans pelagius TaxID=1765746 RepID=UPI003B5CC0E8